ncbi:hypothetical protein DE146DRAFT_755241 [Phaeosphaeria sp. MPI-PUGE-AT-0046c]|nr:hypothetical protein DE146DRAFT_755241 [Phaeosphaeria sp. MPI-PUGE-AT-0046c]
MLLKNTLLTFAAIVSIGFAGNVQSCSPESKCTVEGSLKCHRFGHGTAVYECKSQCFVPKEICRAPGTCRAMPTPHCT